MIRKLKNTLDGSKSGWKMFNIKIISRKKTKKLIQGFIFKEKDNAELCYTMLYVSQGRIPMFTETILRENKKILKWFST